MLGYAIFAAAVGAASLFFYKRSLTLALIAIPIGAAGLWAAFVLALGSGTSHRET